MPTDEQIKRAEKYHVWKARQIFSDDELWEKILDLYGREIEIRSVLFTCYKSAHELTGKRRKFWQAVWSDLVNELDANTWLQGRFIWHLQKRGDPNVDRFVEECKEYARENLLNWVNCEGEA